MKKKAKTSTSLTHGIYSFQKTGRVPSIRGKRGIQRRLKALRAALLEAVPNADDPRRRLLCEHVVQTEGFLILMGEYVKRAGAFNPLKFKHGLLELQPVLGHSYISFMNAQRLALQVLGMDEKQANDVLDLGKYISEFDEAKAKEAAAKEKPGTDGGQDGQE